MKNRTFRYFQNVICLNSEDNLFPSISLKVQKQKFPVRGCNATCSDINYRTRRSAQKELEEKQAVCSFSSWPDKAPHFKSWVNITWFQTQVFWIRHQDSGYAIRNLELTNSSNPLFSWSIWQGTEQKQMMASSYQQWGHRSCHLKMSSVSDKNFREEGECHTRREVMCFLYMSSVPLYSYPRPWYKLTNTKLQKTAIILSGVLSSWCNRILQRGILSLWIFPLPTLSML